MGAQRLKDLPDDLEALIIGQGLLRRHPGGHGDGQNDVAVVLTRCQAHHPADGLDDIDHRVTGLEEEHGVQARDVHAFGQAAGVGQDAGTARAGILPEPVQQPVTFQGVERAVNVLDLAAQYVLVAIVVGVDHLVETRRDHL